EVERGRVEQSEFDAQLPLREVPDHRTPSPPVTADARDGGTNRRLARLLDLCNATPAERQVAHLLFEHRPTPDATAAEPGVTPTTVTVRVHRLRVKIRNHILNNPGGEAERLLHD